MFPYGTEGWALGIQHTGFLGSVEDEMEDAATLASSSSSNSIVSVMEFYRYRLMIRDDLSIHHFRRLY